MKPFKKIIRLGTTKTHGGRIYSIFCAIDWKMDTINSPKNRHLSISGVEGPLPSGNAMGSCGQIDMDWGKATMYFRIKPAPGWTHAMMGKFFSIWKQYHLKREVPEDVLAWVKALPDTDRKPAWV